MDRLDAMEVFSQVAERGSFTAAARSLRRPRSTVTATVQALEARLGVKLLHRTTRRVTLTPDGALYLRECRRLLREVEEVEAGLGQGQAALRGKVRVDVPAAAGRHLLAPALPDFLERHPEIVVELGSSDRPVDLLAEGVDCVIRGGEVVDASLVTRSLARLPVRTLASPAYLARHGVPSSPEALGDHLFVAFFSPRTGRVYEPEFTVDGHLRPVAARYRLAVNDADTWLAATLAGMGLAQIPVSAHIRAHLDRGELVEVLTAFPAGELPLHLLYPRARRLPGRVRAFVDWVVELYAVA
ncbi:LysR family transcriptional regulator [Myxococcota bacterium]|nr:LysR family transcriptional regulator [Myxococcota bacterium]